MEHLTKEEATQFFDEFYGGEHHIPMPIKEFGYGWSVNHNRGSLGTFDFSELTRLVIMAHDKCIRVQVEAVRNQVIRIAIHKRQRDGSMSERHPTLDQAIQTYSKRNN